MAPSIPLAHTTVGYPIFAVDFDPEDANKLVVGGGGGSAGSGVGNKITILDTSRLDELRIAGEVDIPRNEDTVMSLAVGPRKGTTTYLFAGINSSATDIASGKNEHLRLLSAEPSKAKPLSSRTETTPTKPRAFPEFKVTEISRTALFANPDNKWYQRLLRVSGTIGAAATAMAKEPQIVLFDTTPPVPRPRGVLELTQEAEALDIIQTGVDDFQLAYCTRYELYTAQIGASGNSEPRLVFSMPDDHGERPQFRSIRYLTPEFILTVSNLPKKNTGALIHGLRLPVSDHEKARLAVTARMPGKFSASLLAVANLSPPATPIDPVGNTQFVVAVAGNDSSISLFTLEHEKSSSLSVLMKLYPFCTLKNVHGQEQISGLAFSKFIAPKTHIHAQYIKLASTSLSTTTVVHNIPLQKHSDSSLSDQHGRPRPTHYVVGLRSHGPSARPVLTSLAVIVLILAIVAQSVREMYGVGKPLIFAQPFLPSWHGSLRNPDFQHGYLFENKLASLAGGKVLEAGEKLVLLEPATEDVEKVQVDVHDPEAHGPTRTWDELESQEKHAWKERLQEAGAWTQNMGESVFRGVLFGELAGIVGRAVAG